MISSGIIYAIFGGLFVAGIALGYFVSQQQVNELRADMIDVANRIALQNDRIQSLQNQIFELEREVEYYKRPLILEYVKSGGIAGISQSLEIDEFGNLIAASNDREEKSKLSQESISRIKDILVEKNFFDISPTEYSAASGNADFFSYSLTVTMGDLTKQIRWVDEWAAEDELPKELLDIQTEMAIIYDSAFIPLNANTEINNGLKLTLKADKVQYSSGEIVHITAILENLSRVLLQYTSPTPCDLDVRISVKSNSDSYDITYADKKLMPCIQVLQQRELKVGSIIVQEVVWDQTLTIDNIKEKVSSGIYTIEAKFPYANFEETLVTSSIDIQIK